MASAAGASNGGGGGGGSGGVVASQLCSPVLDSSGNLYVVSQGSGEVCSQQSDGSLSVWGRGSGQPSGAAFDAKGNLFVADFGHAAVLKWEASGAQAVVVTEYEGKAFKGPNSLAFDSSGALYFTDSGALGETTLQNPKGSVFCISGPEKTQILRPLALECLAHPSGIAVSPSGNVIFVAETMTNRILRFVQRPAGVFHMSVFCQLSGGLGPSALAFDSSLEVLYVAMYDFKENATSGTVAAIDKSGQISNRWTVPSAEVTGLALSDDGSTLYVTESASNTIVTLSL